MMNVRIFMAAVLAALTFVGSARAETNDVSETELLVEELRLENEALRQENQMLRRELVAKKGALPDAVLPAKAVEPTVRFEALGEDTGYWLSAKSKIRHNRCCRNYRKVKGRPCGPKDGRPCKTCGG